VISGLQAGRIYEARVAMRCGTQMSTFSNILRFQTDAATPDVCDVPQNIQSSMITATSATFTWAPVSSASSYVVYYRSAQGVSEQAVITTSSSLILNILAPQMTYEVQVQANCSTGRSERSTPLRFSTPSLAATCATPAHVQIEKVETNTATIRWEPVTLAARYLVSYRVATSQNWRTEISTSASYALSGLLPGTRYELNIKTVCVNQQESEATPAVMFTTRLQPAYYCAMPVGLYTRNVTATTGELVWDPVAGATSYSILYRPQNSNQWMSVNTVNNTLPINGLIPRTDYEFYVRAYCSDNLWSSYT